MTPADVPQKPDARRARSARRAAIVETLLVFAIFFLQGAWPVPDVNEPYYLGKAKHYWDPSWGARDFFLNTADAHEVFYWSLGWLSLVLPLEAFAWVGRIITWGLLAWSWRRLSAAVVPRPWFAVLTAALFVMLQERAQMAGEWVIGGVEAKGIAYALVFFGLERLLRGGWNLALLFWGAAASFHVLVGGWSVVAAGWAWLWLGRARPALWQIVPGLLAGLVLALPGLWFALELTAEVSPAVAARANEIYVFERLSHHLVPQTFPRPQVVRHVLLFVAFLLLVRLAPRGPAQRRLALFVGGAVAISIAGWIIALTTIDNRELAASLLRYYWFRLADVMLPAGAALLAASAIAASRRLEPSWGSFWLGLAAGLAALHLAGYALDRPFPTRPRADKENKVSDYVAWRQVTAWIADQAPADAVFLTPRNQQTFVWYTGRGEVATWKNIPQDAASIVEWWERLREIHYTGATGDPPNAWRRSLALLTAEELRQLGRKYDAEYLVTEVEPRLPLKLLYENDSYAVYRLGD